MEKLQDKTILFIGCSLGCFSLDVTPLKLTAFFLCICLACLYEYAGPKTILHFVYGAFLAASAVRPEFLLFLPVLFYDMVYIKQRILLIGTAAAALLSFSVSHFNWNLVFILGFGFLSVYLALRTRTHLELVQTYKTQQDNSRELELWLKDKNKDLMERQDYEIRLATLNERNRIAREIHDHVGHMLSRSILQTAALRTISKEPTVKEQLNALSNTLNQAMDNIRESVHDLHDDSLDLENVMEKMVNGYDQYTIDYSYDVKEEMPRDVKYCFLSVVREAFSNVIRHSNASAVRIAVQEFQDFYQLLFQDNGTVGEKTETGRGMGLENMRDRVEAFHGTMNIRTDMGFRIFISIPRIKSR